MKLSFKKLSLRARIILGIISITVIIYLLAAALIIYSAYRDTYKNTISYTDNILNISSLYFSQILNQHLEVLRSIKYAEEPLLENTNPDTYLKIQNNYYTNILYNYPAFLAIATNWEISYLKNNPSLYGRIRYMYYKLDGKVIRQIDTLETEGENISGLYYKYKISKKEGMTEPYYFKYTPSQEPILMSSLFTPILKSNEFIGLVVADVDLGYFYNLLFDIQPFKFVETFLISQENKFVAFTNHKDLTNKPLTKFFPDKYYTKYIVPNFDKKTEFSFDYKDNEGNVFHVTFYPVRIGNFEKPWYIGNIIPQKVLLEPVRRIIRISILISSILLIILFVFSYIVASSLTKFLALIRESMEKLSTGHIDQTLKLDIKAQHEMGIVAQSINRLVDNLIRLSEFAKEIGKGNLDVKIEKVSDDDVLTEAFLEMKRSLQIARIEDTKRKQEEEIQNWLIQGENLFAQILREHSQDIEQLAFHVISNLVKYTGSVQGGLFIINDDNPDNKYIELIAAYAYGRRKFLEKKIPFGVGLIGRAVLEGETIHITQVPEDHLSISSGLGDRHPNSLLIVPFKFNEIIYAVVELASFEGYKAHVRRFVERIGISVASTIANVKITMRTQRLVDQLRTRSQELAAQEEEMRQNLEEMRATQEELRKKASELDNIVKAINEIALVIETTPDGYITDVNEKFIMFLKRRKEAVVNRLFTTVVPHFISGAEFDDLLNELAKGQPKFLQTSWELDNKKYNISLAFIPIIYEDQLQKIIIIGSDITEIEKNENHEQ